MDFFEAGAGWPSAFANRCMILVVMGVKRVIPWTLAAIVVCAPGGARADNAAEAKAHWERGVTAYGLGRRWRHARRRPRRQSRSRSEAVDRLGAGQLMRRPRHVARALLLFVLAAAACNGVTRPCKKGTVLAAITFNGSSADADALEVSVAVDNGMALVTSIGHSAGAATGTIEITFPSGYPMGHQITVGIVAR